MWSSDWPQLGDKVTEIVSGFEGIVVGVCAYLWGCEQVLVSRAGENGKPEAEWFDVGRVRVVEPQALQAVQYVSTPSGADVPAPIR